MASTVEVVTIETPSAVTAADIVAFIKELEMDTPPVLIEEIAQDRILARLPTNDVNLRPGGYVPGPTLMMAVDFVAWLLVFTRAGITPMALTWDLKINFLRPAHGADVMVAARQTKFGKLCHATFDLYMDGDPDRLVGHATTTYALPAT